MNINNFDIHKMRDNATKAEQILKMVANQNRLMILCHLIHNEMSVSDLNKRVDLSQSALSQHLAKMRREGILSTRKEGQQVIYQIASNEVSTIMDTLYSIYCD
tara:strand:+ start:201 stop:509 length:309 start_codon:yes stop_codon:yes gene_type:complete